MPGAEPGEPDPVPTTARSPSRAGNPRRFPVIAGPASVTPRPWPAARAVTRATRRPRPASWSADDNRARTAFSLPSPGNRRLTDQDQAAHPPSRHRQLLSR